MTVSPQIQVALLAPVFPHVSHTPTVDWTDGHAMEPWQARLLRFIAESDWDAQHLPAAELIRASAGEIVPPAALSSDCPLVCADPVHLQVDRDSATLIPAEMLHISDSESAALLTTINEFLQPDALHISTTASGQWLMSGKDGKLLSSYPPSFLAHRNASAFLSDDAGSGSWRRLMTELQMLLHTHPINTAREQQGRMPVNSVWFWGGASLQSGKLAAGIASQSTRLFADDRFAVALARHLGMACEPLAAFDPSTGHPHSLVVDTRLTQARFAEDEAGLQEAECRIVDQWITPLQARIEKGENISLEIDNEDGMRGRLNLSLVQAAEAEAHAIRISQMSLVERLGEKLIAGAGNVWNRLRNTLSRGA